MANGLFDTSGDNIAQYNSQPQQATAPAPSTATTIASSGVAQSLGTLLGGFAQAQQQQRKRQLRSYRTTFSLIMLVRWHP